MKNLILSAIGASRRLATLCALSLLTLTVNAADWDTQLWTTARLIHPVSEEASFSVMAQGRFDNDVTETDITLLELSAGMNVNPSVWIGGGYERFRILGSDIENRVWQEVAMPLQIGDVKISNRVRLEGRYIRTFDGPIFRVRYKTGYTKPLGDNGRYLGLSNEIFFHLNDEGRGPPDGFEQNRLGAAMGFRLGKHLRVETGYQWRYFVTREFYRNDHLFLVNLFWNTLGN